ncbi:MAG: GrpB family protein [Hyphomicrobiaceae bacterium]
MPDEPPFRLIDAERARHDAERLFDAVRTRIAAILPATADIRHIGATAVRGCLTKGDLDIVVRVPADDFDRAETTLASRFARNAGSTRTNEFSAFEDDDSHPHLGIQLVAIDGAFDSFHLFAELLCASPRLVEDYNSLKRRHDGAPMAVYRAAKDAFIERLLSDLEA